MEEHAYLVGILLIDVVLNSMHALLVEVLGGDLDQICNFCLEFMLASLGCDLVGWALTRMNILVLTPGSLPVRNCQVTGQLLCCGTGSMEPSSPVCDGFDVGLNVSQQVTHSTQNLQGF